MILLFTAIFSTISIIEDRREGFLQSVLVAPVSRMSIVLGKVLGGTALAFGQALLFLLLAPSSASARRLAGFALALLFMLVLAFALTALGFCIAWRMNSTQGFHAIMNLFLMPLWFLSGACSRPTARGRAPVGHAPQPAQLRPRRAASGVYLGTPDATAYGPGIAACLLVSVAFAVGLFVLASGIANARSSSGDFE